MSKKIRLDDLLSTKSTLQFREMLAKYDSPMTTAQALSLVKHIENTDPPKSVIDFAIIHTYTSELLDPWMKLQALAEGYLANVYHAPYGIGLMEASHESNLASFNPDVTVMLFQPADLHPEFKFPITRFDKDVQDRIAGEAIETLANLISRFREVVSGLIIFSILPRMKLPDLGLFDMQAATSETAFWTRLKSRLAEKFRTTIESSMLLDMDELLAEVGRQSFFDRRLWYYSRFPFTDVSARELARQITGLGKINKSPKAKVIVLDADNTLWGGIIGEDGVAGIQLGPDYPGNTFLDFQRHLIGLQQRGFVLALCSKNNPDDVDEVLNHHPHQILQQEHFVASRVNWKPKTENLKSIAEELNLGLDAFIFVDDSDYECELVRQELPMVDVIQMPAKPVNVPFVLDKIIRLEISSLTDEDMAKTTMYRQEKKRQQLREQISDHSSDIDEYLRSLEIEVTAQIDQTDNIARLAQLTQKTNQFNLTTRRYNEDIIAKRLLQTNWLVASFSVVDKFGSSGIVGMTLIELCADKSARIDTFLMSCRTIGRKVESAFLEVVLEELKERGFLSVTGEYIATPKNKLVEDFLKKHQFEPVDSGLHCRDLSKSPPIACESFPMKIISLKG